jgi:drug/metabolite transporter (DMT)-like permease
VQSVRELERKLVEKSRTRRSVFSARQLHHRQRHGREQARPRALERLVWLAIGASAVAYFAFFAALKRASATAVSASLFLVPVVAVLVEAARGDPTGGLILDPPFL